MRTIVVVMTVVLTLTGLALAWGPALGFEWRGGSLAGLTHIWGGFFFVVIFPLYAWDHIMARRRWLRALSMISASGSLQTVAAALIIVTGVLLYLYGDQAWLLLRRLHHWPTYLLAASLALHFLSPKTPPKRVADVPDAES